MSFTSVQTVEIDADSDGQRLDNFLFRLLKGVPKSRVYRLLRKGEVRVNGGRAKPSQRLHHGDAVRLPPIRTGDEQAARGPSHEMVERLARAIVYEDDALIVINKPAGMAVHGGSGINAGVIEALRTLRPDEKRLELVHRLDRGTSGCLMIARSRRELTRLQEALRAKSSGGPTELDKTYLLAVHGEWSRARTEVSLALSRRELPGGDRMTRVASDGKPALTEIEVVTASSQYSLVRATPVTGRTHQIRVHCAACGHPVVGDERYGRAEADAALGATRMMLHAERLVIPAREGPAIEVVAPLDRAFSEFKNRYFS